MNKRFIWLLAFFSLAGDPGSTHAASKQIDPTKPGGPARDETLGAPPTPSPEEPVRRRSEPRKEEQKRPRQERMQRMTGIITSYTSLNMVISQEARKAKKTVKFVLRPDTEKNGELKPGALVTVEYQVENNKNIAKRVTVHRPKEQRKPERQPQ